MFQDREVLTGWQVRSAAGAGAEDILSPDSPLMPSQSASTGSESFRSPPRPATSGVRNQLNFLLNAADQLEHELGAQRDKNRRLEAQIMDAYRICESRIRESSRKKEDLFKENADLKATLDSYKYRNTELTAKIEVMDKEVKRFKDSAGKFETTQQHLKDEKKRLHQLVRDMKALAFENEDMARRLVELQAENTGLTDTLRRETVRRKDAERALLEIRDSAETLNRMHSDFKLVSTKVEEDLRALRSKLEMDTKQLREHMEHVSSLSTEAAHDARKSIQITEVVKFQIEKTLAETKSELGHGTARLMETRTALDRMQAEINDTRVRLAIAEKDRTDFTELTTRPLKQAHEIVASQVDRQEAWIRSLQESVGATRAQIEEIQRQKPPPAPPAAPVEPARKAAPDPEVLEKAVTARYDRLNSLFTLKLGSMEEKLGSRFASREPTQSTIQKLRKDLEAARGENLQLRDGLRELNARLESLEKAETERQAKSTAKRSRKSRSRSARIAPENPISN